MGVDAPPVAALGADASPIAPRVSDRASATRLCATAVVLPRAPEFLTDAESGRRARWLDRAVRRHARGGGAVYNNSPYPATFAVKLRAEDKAARRDLGALAVTPSQGALRPYEKRRVTFTMRPALPPNANANENAAASAKGFKSTKNGTVSGEARRGDDGETTPPTREMRLNATISFDANGLVKPLRLPVHARAVIAALAVDPRARLWRDGARDRGDHLVTVRNLSDEMPVDFAFASAFFKPSPVKGACSRARP